MPTTRGRATAAAGAALAAAGLVLGHPELTLLGVLAITAVAAALTQVHRPTPLTATRVLAARRTTPGTALDVVLHLTARHPTQVTERIDGPDGLTHRPLPDPHTHPGPSTYQITADRRGTLDLGPVRTLRTDPLGLAAATRHHGGTDRIWVHPPTHRLHPAPGGTLPDHDGGTDAARTGGLTFHGLRDHVPGDDLRQVHWRASARHGRLLVREHVDTSHPRLLVLVDEHTPNRDALDEIAAAAASLLITALRAGHGCELHLCGGRRHTVHAGSATGATVVLDALAELIPTPTDPVRACRLLATRPPADTAVLLTASTDTATLAAFAALSAHHRTLVAALIGAPTTTAHPGVRLLHAATAADFARQWNRT
ncbi:DUF58 domain-containing protein [Actinomadura craniellae]|uniref:DUF58 domain-containing protein n=1 Tax=Actinomadura craniellae TaxID=2231787 RepID=A0A365H4K6_9ACTN|nr:DUF58 domain-containing protein [Actinomadura craniellae]RAY14040.1 DUF58 domain-containing protein [Actinomadura craniellae]